MAVLNIRRIFFERGPRNRDANQSIRSVYGFKVYTGSMALVHVGCFILACLSLLIVWLKLETRTWFGKGP